MHLQWEDTSILKTQFVNHLIKIHYNVPLIKGHLLLKETIVLTSLLPWTQGTGAQNSLGEWNWLDSSLANSWLPVLTAFSPGIFFIIPGYPCCLSSITIWTTCYQRKHLIGHTAHVFQLWLFELGLSITISCVILQDNLVHIPTGITPLHRPDL